MRLVLPPGLLLAGLLLLGACSLFRPAPPPVPPDEDTADHIACRAEARTSPAMRALNRERNPANEFNTNRLSREARVAFNTAYRDCLRARGLAMPGGVEPQVPR